MQHVKSAALILITFIMLSTLSFRPLIHDASALSIENLHIYNPSLRNVAGEKIDTIDVGQQGVVGISMHNNIELDQPFIVLVEIRDSYGITQYLAWQAGTIAGNTNYTMQISWTPTDDCLLENDEECANNYEIRSFAITSFEAPQVLSAVSMTDGIRVLGFPPNPPLDQYQYDVVLDDGRKYAVHYSFSNEEGKITTIQNDRETSTLYLALVVPEDTRFTLTMPVFLYNYLFVNNAGDSAVEIRAFVDGREVEYGSLVDNEAGTMNLIFNLDQGAREVEIIGSLPL